MLMPVTLLVYLVSTGLYLAYVATFRGEFGEWARRALHVAFLVHVVALAEWMGELGPHKLTSAYGVLPFGAWVLVGGYLVVDWRFRVRVLGAFVTPLISLALLVVLISGTSGAIAPQVRGALLPVHISLALIGVAALALACGVAVLYLLLERQLKHKRFGRVFHRFPSLETLDQINYRCVTIGFPIYTIALLLGGLWAYRLLDGAGQFRLEWGMALLAWLLFGVLLQARIIVGWRGRRAALLTIAGFSVVLGVLAQYLVRGGGGI